MTDVLILTAEEAEKVRGRSPKDRGCALYPAPLKDGRCFLGLEVLDDPAHEDVRDFLAAMPREPLDKLPIYTADDLDIPIVEEVARLAVRTEKQAADRRLALDEKAAQDKTASDSRAR